MDSIRNPTIRERNELSIINQLYQLKQSLGWVFKKTTNDLKRKAIVNGIDELWAANLVDMNSFSKLNDESVKPKFLIGDRDRITKKKVTLEKGYTLRWIEEVFTVSQFQFTDPLTYKVADNNGEEIQSSLYEQELQKTDQKMFRIEKVVAQKLLLESWLKYDIRLWLGSWLK
ncbi:uncharacterized protein LOC136079502 [Hydra vulgaris]|uniref:Uncharacterized protein LOC136079502 n=1 Tax=Hydra vulgaris TaxID=6087 RepID=A0ABM4BQA8_HYDVU